MSKEVLKELKRWEQEAVNPLNDKETKIAFREKIYSICAYFQNIEGYSIPCQDLKVYVEIHGGQIEEVNKPGCISLEIHDFDIGTTEFY